MAAADIGAVVGIERGLYRQGQHLAGPDAEQQQHAAPGLVVEHRGFQFPVCQVLQALVQGQGQRLSGNGLFDVFYVLDDGTVQVLQHPFLARVAAQPVVKGEFDAFLSLIIDIGKPNQVGSHLAQGVVSLVLLAGIDSRYFQRLHPARRVGRHMPLQVKEIPVQARRQQLPELFIRRVQQAGQFSQVRA